MNAEQILPVLADLLEYQLGCEKQQVIPSARFNEDLGADSLDHVEIIMAVEEEFSIDIPDEDAERIQTVQQAIDYLVKVLPA